mmetsp:Transcript_2095/g.3033  ORF Transcript_2095/g.3033 Transcript_2095/m.3033 type:complete len:550 (+) Transcript_2095:70-1719(+)
MKQTLIFAIMMIMMVASILATKIKISEEGSDNIGARVILEREGLTKSMQTAIPDVEKLMKELEIPDQQMTQHVAVIGDVDVNITDISITQAKINDFKMELTPPATVGMAVEGIELGISLNWKYYQHNWPHAAGHGDANAAATDTLFKVAVSVTKNAQDKPQFKLESATLTIGHMDVNFSGGASGWVLNLLKGIFESKIKDVIQQTVQQQLEDNINNQLNQKINETPFLVPMHIDQLDLDLEMDVTLPEPLSVTDSEIFVSNRMETYIAGNHAEPPFKPAPLPTKVQAIGVGNIFVSTWVANDLFYQAQKTGKLDYIIKPQDVPADSPIQLNTTFLKNYLPDLYEKFPDQLIQIEVKVTKAPTFTSKVSSGQVLANTTLLFSIYKGENDVQKAFLANLGLNALMDKVGLKDVNNGAQLNLTGHIQTLAADLTLAESYIGDISIDRFALFLKIIIENGLLTQINADLGVGVPLVLPKGLTITDTKVEFQDGYIHAACYISYKPPTGSIARSFLKTMFLTAAEKRINERYHCAHPLLRRVNQPCKALAMLYP